VTEVLLGISEHPLYVIGMWFLAAFPIVISMFAINGSRQYLLDRSREATENDLPHLPELHKAREQWPLISIVIPARDEGAGIARTLQSVLELHWPRLEVIVINDGSIDDTADHIARLGKHVPVSVITHETPRGKSQSLNEGIAAASSELVLIMDADARPARNALDRMAPHFLHYEDVAAVTGNPRVANISSLLAKLQAVEFTSTVSTLRRGQSAWGRVNTMSGIMTLLRRELVLEQGGFSSTQPTEDIELTWRLHRQGYRCIYEPAAQVAMEVPDKLGQWWRQRTRWSSGLIRVLQTHGFGIVRKGEWPVFAILLEAIAAVLWCHVLVAATIFWVVSAVLGVPTLGNSLIIGHWGTMAVGIALIQIFWGMRLDSHHDKSIASLWPVAPLYPILYWWMGALAVVWTTIPTLLTKPRVATWSLRRKEHQPAPAPGSAEG
jgi:poly-beta-1,6-N-acetyl-D-glucosamine synthase